MQIAKQIIQPKANFKTDWKEFIFMMKLEGSTILRYAVKMRSTLTTHKKNKTSFIGICSKVDKTSVFWAGQREAKRMIFKNRCVISYCLGFGCIPHKPYIEHQTHLIVIISEQQLAAFVLSWWAFGNPGCHRQSRTNDQHYLFLLSSLSGTKSLHFLWRISTETKLPLYVVRLS